MFNGQTWAYLPWATMLPSRAWGNHVRRGELGPICRMIPSFLKEFGPISPSWLPWVPSHVSPRTSLIYLGQPFSLKLGPILHQNIMFPWVHCKETWSHCNGLKLQLGQLFLVGHCHFHSFFSNEGHLGRKIDIKRFEFWISHLTLNWHLIKTFILFSKKGLMAAEPPRNRVKYWNFKNPIHCSSTDFKLDFFI